MVYINSSGEVQNSANFSATITKLFWGFVYFVMFFFRSLLGPLLGDSKLTDPDSQSRYRSNLRGGNGRDGWGGGGGGGGGRRPGGGGGGGGRGPGRPMGRLNMDGPASMPSCPMGGCCR